MACSPLFCVQKPVIRCFNHGGLHATTGPYKLSNVVRRGLHQSSWAPVVARLCGSRLLAPRHGCFAPHCSFVPHVSTRLLSFGGFGPARMILVIAQFSPLVFRLLLPWATSLFNRFPLDRLDSYLSSNGFCNRFRCVTQPSRPLVSHLSGRCLGSRSLISLLFSLVFHFYPSTSVPSEDFYCLALVFHWSQHFVHCAAQL